jgi:hypothetical protein
MENMIIVTVPHIPNLLDALLKEFCWDFQNKEHPVTTGNCSGHGDSAGGRLDGDGFYENATWHCSHCYPGSNPARLDWSDIAIGLTCDVESTKQVRIIRVFHQINQTRRRVHFGEPEYDFLWPAENTPPDGDSFLDAQTLERLRGN